MIPPHLSIQIYLGRLMQFVYNVSLRFYSSSFCLLLMSRNQQQCLFFTLHTTRRQFWVSLRTKQLISIVESHLVMRQKQIKTYLIYLPVIHICRFYLFIYAGCLQSGQVSKQSMHLIWTHHMLNKDSKKEKITMQVFKDTGCFLSLTKQSFVFLTGKHQR